MSRRLTPMDTMFLYGETGSSMMHVASVLLVTPPATPPEGAAWTAELADAYRSAAEVEEPWNLRLKHPMLKYHPANTWVEAERVDLDFHVRRWALPAPGDDRELGILISRLHSQPLDLSRPPWEVHLVEGLADGRVAVYTKVHHALIDGISGMGLLERSLSTDADEQRPAFFAQKLDGRAARPGGGGGVPGVPTLVRFAAREVGAAAKLGKALVDVNLRRRGKRAHLVGSTQAPHTLLNGAVSRNRRFATQEYELARLKRLGKKYDATINDVVLAIIGGGLRQYLVEQGALPESPLVGFLPVSVHPKGDTKAGNSTGAVLASLATDVDDPVDRLRRVVDSTRVAKSQLEGMPAEAALAYSAALLAPHLVVAGAVLARIPDPLPYTFNVCVSNIPGPSTPRYLRGALVDAVYPVSIPTHGMALNITLHSYNGTLFFGFVGCPEAVPNLQRLAVYTGRALEELEQATWA